MRLLHTCACARRYDLMKDHNYTHDFLQMQSSSLQHPPPSSQLFSTSKKAWLAARGWAGDH